QRRRYRHHSSFQSNRPTTLCQQSGFMVGKEGCGMTPAILLARKSQINHVVHEYAHDPEAESYGDEAAEKLGQPPERVFKTLVVQLDAALAVAILPVNAMLSLKQMAKAAGSKKAAMADMNLAQRSTGYVLGGVSPLAQKKRLLTVL